MMITRFSLLTLLITLAVNLASAQTDAVVPTPAKSKGRPNIPGTFVLEIGVNRTLNQPDSFKIGFWGSRTFNVIYQYDLRIGKSKFSFHPGLGLGFERFKLTNLATLGYVETGDTTKFINSWNLYDRPKKSSVIMNYIDIPLELRFSTNPEDPARSFKVAIGARIGYLFDSGTKLKYRQDGENRKVKNDQLYNLNQLRYGGFLKVGGGNFAVFCDYNVSTLFQEGLGPKETTMNTMTIGISLSSF